MSATIASQIKGKSVEDNRAYFGVVADFADSEEELIKEETRVALEHF